MTPLVTPRGALFLLLNDDRVVRLIGDRIFSAERAADAAIPALMVDEHAILSLGHTESQALQVASAVAAALGLDRADDFALPPAIQGRTGDQVLWTASLPIPAEFLAEPEPPTPAKKSR
jgi:hypothetical protein